MTKRDGKPCKKCETSLWYDNGRCKQCRRVNQVKYMLNNPTAYKESRDRYRLKNLNKIKAYQDAYRIEVRAKVKARREKRLAKENGG